MTKIERQSPAVWWTGAIVHMALIYYLSSRTWPMLMNAPDFHFPDKFVHMLTYIPLAFVFSIALKKSGMKKYVLITGFILATLYGITDEVHQVFVPGRCSDVSDALADIAGAFIGGISAALFNSRSIEYPAEHPATKRR
jgi:VanZ family protein